jgi:hypothetical protein
VQHRNRKLYARLRKCIAEKDNWYVFSNEHHRLTYIERQPQETPNDRNDRAIRVASRWCVPLPPTDIDTDTNTDSTIVAPTLRLLCI